MYMYSTACRCKLGISNEISTYDISATKVLNVFKIKQAINTYTTQFILNHQHDAHEYLITLLDLWQEESLQKLNAMDIEEVINVSNECDIVECSNGNNDAQSDNNDSDNSICTDNENSVNLGTNTASVISDIIRGEPPSDKKMNKRHNLMQNIVTRNDYNTNY